MSTVSAFFANSGVETGFFLLSDWSIIQSDVVINSDESRQKFWQTRSETILKKCSL